MEKTFDTVDEAWLWAVAQTLTIGVQSTPRSLRTLEIADPVHMRIVKPDEFPIGGADSNGTGGRMFRHVITAVEACSLIGQVSVPELITDRVKAFRPFLNGSIFWGAYGPRVAGDLGLAVDLIYHDPDTRQAVVSIYDSDRDLGRPELVDVPCTLTIQFKMRGAYGSHRLSMWVVMRSNDAWLGLPYDLGQFALLQSAVAWALGCSTGVYMHSAGSMHLYHRDHEKADQSNAVGLTDLGWRVPLAWGVPFGGGADTFALIAQRCRRLLLGQTIDDPTPLEAWLARNIGALPVPAP